MNRLFVDYTHTWRKVTGIERIADELFSRNSLSEVTSPVYISSANSRELAFGQWIELPFCAMKDSKAIFICPCFPPSILLSAVAGDRVIPYIHDLFLMTRSDDLNWRAKLYLRPSFSYAVKNLRKFFVNSSHTEKALRNFCHPSAEIIKFRPMVRDLFGLRNSRSDRIDCSFEKVKFVAMGTVEPRKNYGLAVKVIEGLAQFLGRSVELHIIGRLGWGEEIAPLQSNPRVVLHNYCTTKEIVALIGTSDFFICTSFEEGLGLPILEVQHSGIPIIANDIPVLRETLEDSAIFIDARAIHEVLFRIASLLSDVKLYNEFADRSRRNILRWNGIASVDRANGLEAIHRWLQ